MKLRGDSMSEAEAVVEDMSVDWRGRPCKPTKHGGMRAAVFVLGLSLLSLLSHVCLFHILHHIHMILNAYLILLTSSHSVCMYYYLLLYQL